MDTIKLYYAAAALLAVVIAVAGVASAWSAHKLAAAEKEVERLRGEAEKLDASAARYDLESRQYKAKIEFLESQLSEITSLARKQDDQLQHLSETTSARRADAGRAASVRSIAVDAAELCRRLAELGHACR
jgi:chromosome segregation ATPase